MKTATPWLLEGVNSGLNVFSYYATLTAVATKTKPIGNYDDCQFTIILNSTSTAAPIGLPPKMAKFCHTSNRLLVGRWHRRALLQLYFNSSAVSRWSLVIGCWSLVVGRWSLIVGRWSLGVGHALVHNKGSQALGGFPPKGKMLTFAIFSLD